MRTVFLFALALAASLSAGERRVVVPEGAPKPIGPYSPGVWAGDWLFVSGQGVRTPAGLMPPNVTEQTRQCMENVKAIVIAAGLTMDHLVYTQLYVTRMEDLPAIDAVYRQYFHAPYPARAVIGVEHMPLDTTVEINAVAVRDPALRRAVAGPREHPASPAMSAGDRLYVSTITGETESEVERRLRGVLKRAGFPRDGLVFANWFSSKGIPVKSLPDRSAVGISGVWTNRRVAAQSGCTRAGEAVFCTATSGAGPDIEAQVKDVMTQLDSGLKANGLSLQHVTATNVWLNNLADFQRMNKMYGSFFTGIPPARTTVQPLQPSSGPLVRISLVAVK